MYGNFPAKIALFTYVCMVLTNPSCDSTELSILSGKQSTTSVAKSYARIVLGIIVPILFTLLLACRFNHSCMPNVNVVFPRNNSTAVSARLLSWPT